MISDKIRFVIPDPQNIVIHTLYLDNHKVVRINSVSGEILSVATLPDMHAVLNFRAR